MMRELVQIIIGKRAVSALLVAIITACAASAVFFLQSRKLASETAHLRTELNYIQENSGRARAIKSLVQSREKNLARAGSSGIVASMEHMLRTLDIKARAIKPLGTSKVNRFSEDSAEIKIENAGLNSIVNLLYKIRVNPSPMKIQSVSLQSSFENRDLFMLTMKIALVQK